MLEFFRKLLDTSDFPARWHCGRWTDGHGWLHIISDLAIFAAYLAIPVVLGAFVLKRRDLPFHRVFWLFIAFIAFCGTTHLIEAIIFWEPVYRLSGVVKLGTAIVSWSTVLALVPILPKALALSSPEVLEREVAQRTRELEQEKAKLEAVLANLSTGVLVTDRDGKFTMFNTAGRTIIGMEGTDLPPDEWAAHYEIFDLDGHTVIPTDQLPMVMVLKGGEDRANRDMVIRNSKGDERVVELTASAIRSRGERDGAVVVFHDVTERRNAEVSIQRANLELKRSNRDLEQFAYVVSHDLKEPLRTVSSYCELLESRYAAKLDDSAKQYIGFAVEGSSRMQKLVGDLLRYSRLQTDAQAPEPVPMASLVETAMAQLETVIAERGAKITVSALPTASVDSTQLMLVFQNLIGNAIKFSGDRVPEIAISAEQNGEEWTIAVADNGIGIDASHTDRIFQMFQRLHSRDKFEGTGIGLAIAMRVIERHGGRLWVESEVGHGSTFYFSLPAKQ